jgi:hypothetical protein
MQSSTDCRSKPFLQAGLALDLPPSPQDNLLERIAQPPVLEDLFEHLLDCPDESAWLARLQAAAGAERP